MAAGPFPVATPSGLTEHRYLWLPDPTMALTPLTAVAAAAAVWTTANTALFMPFVLKVDKTLDKITVWNGGVVAGNIDVGIYKADGTKVVSKGATAVAGVNAPQSFDLTDTLLQAGVPYYAALVCSDASTNQLLTIVTTAALSFVSGFFEQAAVGTLPSPAVFATPSTLTKAPLVRLDFTA